MHGSPVVVDEFSLKDGVVQVGCGEAHVKLSCDGSCASVDAHTPALEHAGHVPGVAPLPTVIVAMAEQTPSVPSTSMGLPSNPCIASDQSCLGAAKPVNG